MKAIIFCTLVLVTSKVTIGQERKIILNLVEYFNENPDIIFQTNDSLTVKRVFESELDTYFSKFRIYEVKLTLVLGHHVNYEKCLIITTNDDDIIELQKPWYWNGINHKFWESLQVEVTTNYNYEKAFDIVQNLILYFDETISKYDIKSDGRNIVFEKPVFSEKIIESRCYKKTIDEESEWMYKMSLFFILTASIDNKFEIKILD